MVPRSELLPLKTITMIVTKRQLNIRAGQLVAAELLTQNAKMTIHNIQEKMLEVSLIVTLEIEYMINELINVRKEVRIQNY